MVQVAYFPLPSAAVAVIVAVPADTAVTRPSASTVAMDSLEDDHVMFLFEALVGATVALS